LDDGTVYEDVYQGADGRYYAGSPGKKPEEENREENEEESPEPAPVQHKYDVEFNDLYGKKKRLGYYYS
jgi:hypothetical protein